ncbi:MAG: hypothetical protein WA138_02730 [Parvibaculum sp.]
MLKSIWLKSIRWLKSVSSMVFNSVRGAFDVNFLISLVLALGIWVALRNEAVWSTFLGDADREALQIAFNMRVNKTLEGTGPILFLNLDDSVWHGDDADSPPLAYAPRNVVYNLLKAAYGEPGYPRPRVVITDFDLFWRTPDKGPEDQIDALLEQWGKDPDAPLLILQREVMDGDGSRLNPASIRLSPRDRFIRDAPQHNIVWASAIFTGDEVVGARYYEHFLCLKSEHGVDVVANTALYAIAGRSATSPRQAIEQVNMAMEAPRRYCADGGKNWFELPLTGRAPIDFSGRGSLINYNSMPPGGFDYTTPDLIAADMFIIPAATVSMDMISGLASNNGIVIIGSASLTARDRHMSVYGLMGGSLIIANTIRGLEVGGVVHRLHWYIEAIILSCFVTLIVLAFWYSRQARDFMIPIDDLPWYAKPFRLPLHLTTNPVIMKILIGITVFWLGAFATYYMLDYGLWIGFAAPAYAAALNEAREDFEELMENLREKRTHRK